MENVGLKVVLEAETSKATNGVDAFNKKLLQTPNAVSKVDASVSTLGKTIAALKAKLDAAKFDREGFFDPKKIAASNAEVQKLQAEIKRLENTGKVGFDSLGNSIKKTTGSSNLLGKSFGALRTAANILPGIGIAGIFGLIGEAVISLVGELTKASGHFTEIRDILGSSAEAAYKAKQGFDGFITTLSDSRSSTAQQQLALQGVNKELKEYGVQLNSVADAQKFGAEIGKVYAEIKGEEAKQTALSALAAKEYANQIQIAFTAQQGGVVDIAKTAGVLSVLKNGFKNITNPAVGAIVAINGITEATKKSTDTQEFFNAEVEKSKERTAGLTEVLKALTKPLVLTKEKTEKAAKAVKEAVIKIREAINEGLVTDGNNGLILDAVVRFRKEQIKDEIKSIQDLVKDVNTPVVIPASLGSLGIVSPIKKEIDAIEAENKRLQDIREQFQATLAGIAQDLIIGFAEGIGQALAGVKDPFAPLVMVLGDGLIALGKQVIATSTLMVALKKALSSIGIAPGAALPIGFALVALGSFLKAKVQQTKFAAGGIVTGPTNALIGEAGPEVVFPLNKLDSFLSDRSGGSQVVVMETVVRGADILLVQQRAGASFKRTNG